MLVAVSLCVRSVNNFRGAVAMSLLYLKKIISLLLSYGWFGLLYGSLFTLLPQERGYVLHPVASGIVVLFCIVAVVSWGFWLEMRRYTPPRKFYLVAFIGLVGLVAGVKLPLLYPLFFLLLMAAMAYPCRDCVKFTRLGR